MNVFSKVVFLKSIVSIIALAAPTALLMSCAKKPAVEEGFKQIQLNWNAFDDAAENSEWKDNCVIEITSKVMRDPVVLGSKLVEITYEVFYRVDETGELAFDARCGDTRFADLQECSWRATCGGGSVSVVKFHNER